MCETAQLYCYLGTIENRGKITASIHTPKRDVFISNGNGNGNENISNAPPTVDRRRIT